MITEPLVSIVTPSFNQVAFLERTICSVLEQDYPNLEYIIIDGGSSDGSVDIIEKYADRLSYWISESDLGQTDAINKGFAASKGEILAWLNSDDSYRPGAIRGAVQYLADHPEVGMVYGDAFYIDESDTIVGKYPSKQTDYNGLRRGVNTISQQSMFFRSKLWKMVGPLDPSFFYAMDFDLWVRIAAVSKIAYHPEAWANFRLHGDSKSMTLASRCWPEIVRVHLRDGGSRWSRLYIKYLLRRVVEPIVPLRMEWRKLKYRLSNRNR